MSSNHIPRQQICIIAIGFSPSKEEAINEMAAFAQILSQLVNPPQFIYLDNKAWMDSVHLDGVSYQPSPQGNIGFGAAVNLARSFTEAKRLLLVNLDILIDSQSLAAILERIAILPENEIWAPQLLNEDLSPQTWQDSLYTKNFVEELSSTFGYPVICKNTPKSERLFYLRGAIFSVSTALFDKLGGFDPKFFLFGEEADFCYRSAPHAKLIFDSSIKVVHLGSQGNRSKSMFALRHSLRARFLLQKRFGKATAAFSLVPFLWIAYVIEWLKRATVRKFRQRLNEDSSS